MALETYIHVVVHTIMYMYIFICTACNQTHRISFPFVYFTYSFVLCLWNQRCKAFLGTVTTNLVKLDLAYIADIRRWHVAGTCCELSHFANETLFLLLYLNVIVVINWVRIQTVWSATFSQTMSKLAFQDKKTVFSVILNVLWPVYELFPRGNKFSWQI